MVTISYFAFLLASLGKALYQKACHQDAIKRRKTHNCVGTDKFLGGAAGRSKLIEQILDCQFCPFVMFFLTKMHSSKNKQFESTVFL